MTQELIARASDIGFGNSKYTLGRYSKENGTPCDLFASIAIPSTGRNVGANLMSDRNTIEVEVEGITYEVGPDAALMMDSNSSRSLDLEFVRKPTYLALLRGSLAYMQVEHIDMLAVGLPVSSYEAMSPVLERTLVGVHRVGSGNNARDIEVRNVIVAPQPVGGLYDHGIRTGSFKSLMRETNVIIDPGYFTLDWVVTVGQKVVTSRSGSAENCGMAAILRAIANSIAVEYQRSSGKPGTITESVLQKLDDAIRKNREFRYHGQVVDIRPHLKAGQLVVEAGLDKLMASIGSNADIDNVLIGGGTQHMYNDAVGRLFPGFQMMRANEPVFSNVRGFQLIAELKMKGLAQAVQAA